MNVLDSRNPFKWGQSFYDYQEKYRAHVVCRNPFKWGQSFYNKEANMTEIDYRRNP